MEKLKDVFIGYCECTCHDMVLMISRGVILYIYKEAWRLVGKKELHSSFLLSLYKANVL